MVAETNLELKTDNKERYVNQPRCIVGQPVQAVYSIRTTFCWGETSLQSCEMYYEIEEDRKDWILSGQRKGSFTAKVSDISVTLKTD